jgi:hypothetical protein
MDEQKREREAVVYSTETQEKEWLWCIQWIAVC